MSALDLGAMFFLGTASSLHCVQMCGPLVVAFSAAFPPASLRPHAAYHAGRLLTYAMLGAAAGALGQATGLLGRLTGIEQILTWISGGLMILMGLYAARGTATSGLVQIQQPSLARRLTRAVGRILLQPTAGSKFRLGLALGLLPCGLVYAALLKAMATAQPWQGAGTMLAFGAGTAGALLAVGLFSARIGKSLTRFGPRVAAAGFLLLGFLLIWRGFQAPVVNAQAPACHVPHAQ